MLDSSVKLLLVILGWIFVALGIIGIFLPVLPTTPFILLAALCFSKGSQRLHEWLLSNKYFGKGIRDWEKHGVIRKRAKISATCLIIPLFSYTLIFVDVVLVIKILVALIGIGALVFIWSRPSAPDLSTNP